MSTTTTPYYDQNHPFWAFVADLHRQGPAHPFFARSGGPDTGDAAQGGSGEERSNPWGRMRRGHGPHRQPRHARFATQQDEEMGDLTTDTEVDEKTLTPGDDTLVSGDEEPRASRGRHGGRMGGRGRGRGFGFRGGRGGMGARFAQAGPTEVPSDGENALSGDEFHRGPGMRRGGRFAGRGRGCGGPRARAAAGEVGVAEPTVSGAENQEGCKCKQHERAARRAARLAARGRGAGADREVLFDATAPGQSDEENAVSGDEKQRGPGKRRAMGMGGRGRGRGAGMGRGRGGAFGLRGEGIARDVEVVGPRAHGRLGRHGPHGPHAHGHGPHAHGPHAHGPHAMHEHGPMAIRARPNRHADGKFRPEVDVFDHTEGYVVHVSVPGAKKKDIEVNWNAEKSALSITGTINRAEDEEMLKTISTNERNVGEFKRMVRLGNKGSPAQVDVEGIKAKIEDGVLRIEVPKMESDFVEVKKVDVA